MRTQSTPAPPLSRARRRQQLTHPHWLHRHRCHPTPCIRHRLLCPCAVTHATCEAEATSFPRRRVRPSSRGGRAAAAVSGGRVPFCPAAKSSETILASIAILQRHCPAPRAPCTFTPYSRVAQMIVTTCRRSRSHRSRACREGRSTDDIEVVAVTMEI
jgi:hypothetical protein